MNINSNTSLNDLLEYAKHSLRDIKHSDDEFILSDLFRGFEWKRIQRGNRTKLGSMFILFSQSEGTNIIEATDKTPQNQQKYKLK